MQKYILNTIERVSKEKESLFSPEDYTSNKRRRLELAQFYKELLNIGVNFLARPKGMTQSVADNLSKDVNATCGECLKPSVMRSVCKNALSLIHQYIAMLEAWRDSGAVSLGDGSVHDMKPNI